MSLQPSAATKIDRTTTAPFLLRLYFRYNRTLEPWEFSLAPPADTSAIPDYSSLLPASLRQQSVQIYTWPTCTLSELTGLLTSVLPGAPGGALPVGTRLVYKLIFPDTRSGVSESGRGRWVDRPLGSVVVGDRSSSTSNQATHEDDETPANGNNEAETEAEINPPNLSGDADKALADARFVIGDYIACSIYPPSQDGRVAPPPSSRAPREPYVPPRGPPSSRENGFGSSRGEAGFFRGGFSGRPGTFGRSPPPQGEWRRGDRPPPSGGAFGGGGGGGYRGRGDWGRRAY